MAGTGADPDECQGSGADHRHDLAGGVAGTWKTGPQEDRRLGGLGTDERGQWQEARLPQDQGWTGGGAERIVHVNLGGDTLQPIDPGSASAIIEEGEGEEGGVDRVHAEVPNNFERNDARSNPIQAKTLCLRWTVFPFKGGFCS